MPGTEEKVGILAAPQISKEHIGVLVAAMLVLVILLVVLGVLVWRRKAAERRGF
jgi:membrane protein DedA with SNARE-associated domain